MPHEVGPHEVRLPPNPPYVRVHVRMPAYIRMYVCMHAGRQACLLPSPARLPVLQLGLFYLFCAKLLF